jgi:hypothetical protein
VRAQPADRALRRRPRQLHLPALEHRLLVRARLRRRQAGGHQGRVHRRTTSCSSPATRATPIAC